MVIRLRRFLDDLLDLLREDYPRQFQEITRDARGITCLQRLDRETAIIKVRERTIRVTGAARESEINLRIHLSRDCLFKILEGRQTLEEAINSGDLTVFGDPEVLLSFYKVWERVLSLARTSPRFYFLTYRLRR
ncbi:MAG: SCP2 sterol-binding domain-containing protein [Nitrososphaerales archaeon]